MIHHAMIKHDMRKIIFLTEILCDMEAVDASIPPPPTVETNFYSCQTISLIAFDSGCKMEILVVGSSSISDFMS